MVEVLECREIWGGNRAVTTAVSTPGLDVHVLSRPIGEAGGDVYYLSSCAKGMVSRLVLADVSGHGATVAPVAERLRELMDEHVNAFDHTEFVRALNEQFVAMSRSGGFATAIVLSFYAPARQLLVVNAGHPDPLLFRSESGDGESGTWGLLRHDSPVASTARGDLPLGVIAPTSYRQFAVELGDGDLVVLYTDALIEAGANGEPGQGGLLRIASDLDPRDAQHFGERLLSIVESRYGPARDDATVIVAAPNAAPTTERRDS